MTYWYYVGDQCYFLIFMLIQLRTQSNIFTGARMLEIKSNQKGLFCWVYLYMYWLHCMPQYCSIFKINIYQCIYTYMYMYHNKRIFGSVHATHIHCIKTYIVNTTALEIVNTCILVSIHVNHIHVCVSNWVHPERFN